MTAIFLTDVFAAVSITSRPSLDAASVLYSAHMVDFSLYRLVTLFSSESSLSVRDLFRAIATYAVVAYDHAVFSVTMYDIIDEF